MKELLDKLSSYNLFNYLLPGIIFVVIGKEFTPYSFVQEDIIVGVFVYYFVGLAISRFGSLIVEPLLRKFSLLKFEDYSNFIATSKKDPKIEILSEVNNMYRTFSSMFVLLLMMKLYVFIEPSVPALREYNSHLLILSLSVIFLCSYRKQTQFIANRIKYYKE